MCYWDTRGMTAGFHETLNCEKGPLCHSRYGLRANVSKTKHSYGWDGVAGVPTTHTSAYKDCFSS